MKIVVLLVGILINTVCCMNTKENMNIKNTPEEYFQGKDLVMANASG